MHVRVEECRVCQNDKRRKNVCKACARRYLQCHVCGTEHLELAEQIGIRELRIERICRNCGPSGNELDGRLLKQRNNAKLKPEDSYMQKRISS